MRRRTLFKLAAASMLPAPAIAQNSRASTLRFVPQANLSVLDPTWTTATVTGNHGFYVFDMLYGQDAQLRPQPQMAEGHEISDDKRTWRFRLRDGLKFHDGSPVRGVDCIASIKRWAAKEPSYGALLAKVVDSYVAIDDRSFEIRLTRPFPLMLDALSKPDASAAFIMPERLAGGPIDKPITEMVGSGPYRFVASEYNSGSKVVYEKFADYVPRKEAPVWTAGGKVAHFQRVEWQVIPDPATAAAALQNGEVDWWERPLADLQPMLARNPDIRREVTDPTGRMAIMRLNALQKPFDDVRLRQAIRLAVKQEDYMRATQGDDTQLWSTCPCIWPRHTEYFNPDDARLMPGDLNQAKALLQQAGYAGEKVVIISPSDFPDIGPLGQVTADLLGKMGMNVDLRESDWGTVVQRRASREPVDKGGWSIFHTTGSSGAWASPASSFLVRGQGKSGWFGWWESPKAEELVQDWLAAPDEAAQKKTAQALGTLVLTDAPTIPLGQFVIRTAYRTDLTHMLQAPVPAPWNLRRG